MNRDRLVAEAKAQLAAEAVRLDGIEQEILAHEHPDQIPEHLKDDLRHAQDRLDAASAMVVRLSSGSDPDEEAEQRAIGNR